MHTWQIVGCCGMICTTLDRLCPAQNSIHPTPLRDITNGLTERDRADIAQMEDGLPAGWIVAFRQHRGAIFQENGWATCLRRDRAEESGFRLAAGG